MGTVPHDIRRLLDGNEFYFPPVYNASITQYYIIFKLFYLKKSIAEKKAEAGCSSQQNRV